MIERVVRWLHAWFGALFAGIADRLRRPDWVHPDDRHQASATERLDGSWTKLRWTDVDWSEHTRDFLDDLARIRYCDYGAGRPLVLLHGMACCWEWWLECLPELGRHFRVIAVDLPGFGDSEPLPEPAEISDYADVVARLIRHLGLQDVVVAGHSMGGLVAISTVERHPELVGRLVLVDAGGVPMSEQRLEAVLKVLRFAHRTFTRPFVLKALASSRSLRKVALRGALRDPDVMSDALAAVVVPRLNAPAFANSIRASATAVRDSRPESITVPTSLIWGERDVFAPVDAARDMLDRLPHGRLDVIKGVGHSPMVEAPLRMTRLLIREADVSDSFGARAAQ